MFYKWNWKNEHVSLRIVLRPWNISSKDSFFCTRRNFSMSSLVVVLSWILVCCSAISFRNPTNTNPFYVNFKAQFSELKMYVGSTYNGLENVNSIEMNCCVLNLNSKICTRSFSIFLLWICLCVIPGLFIHLYLIKGQM